MDQSTAKFYDQFVTYMNDKNLATVPKVSNSIFPILTNYFEKMLKLGDPIAWKQIEAQMPQENKMTVCVFGELGTGKSTILNLISKIFAKNHANNEEGKRIVQFKS